MQRRCGSRPHHPTPSRPERLGTHISHAQFPSITTNLELPLGHVLAYVAVCISSLEKAVQRIKSASAGVGLHLGWQGCAPADAADALELMSTAGAYETTNCLAGCADQRISVHLSLAAGDVPRGTRLDQRPARTTA